MKPVHHNFPVYKGMGWHPGPLEKFVVVREPYYGCRETIFWETLSDNPFSAAMLFEDGNPQDRLWATRYPTIQVYKIQFAIAEMVKTTKTGRKVATRNSP